MMIIILACAMFSATDGHDPGANDERKDQNAPLDEDDEGDEDEDYEGDEDNENELEDEGDDMSMLRIRMMDIMRMEITGKKMMKTMIVRIMRWG